MGSRFARVRVRAAHGDRARAEEWLLIEWPKGEVEPTRCWSDVAAGQHPQAACPHSQGALEDRARLSGAQKRAWPRPFRRPWLERVSSYMRACARRLWLSDAGAAQRPRKKSRSIPRTSPTRRLPATRGSGRCSATSPGPSPPCPTGWGAPSPERLHNVLGAACATSMGNAWCRYLVSRPELGCSTS